MKSQIMSDAVKLSRRSRSFLILSGWGSNARTNTYKFDASWAIFASVLNRASLPSVGRHSLNPVIGGAVRQISSSSLASIVGADAARVEVAPLSVGGGTRDALCADTRPSTRGGVCCETCKLRERARRAGATIIRLSVRKGSGGCSTPLGYLIGQKGWEVSAYRLRVADQRHCGLLTNSGLGD